MSDYIHGGSDEREVARLEKQAGFVSPMHLPWFDAAPGMRVLDLATGVGAMAGVLLERYPGIRLVGVDLRAAQLRHAVRNHPQAAYAQANGTALPFADGTFERLHCSWLLEHVPPAVAVAILREVRRVLAPGGYCLFIEVDNAAFGTEPPLPEVNAAMDALNQAQLRGGGDPFVGQRLGALFSQAGFERVELINEPARGDAGDPVHFQAFIDEFAEIFESLDESIGGELLGLVTRAAAQLRTLPGLPGSSIRYRPFVARGWR